MDGWNMSFLGDGLFSGAFDVSFRVPGFILKTQVHRFAAMAMDFLNGQLNPSSLKPWWPWFCQIGNRWKVGQIITRWWFQIFFLCIPIWGRFPIWLIFFRWVETTNQITLPCEQTWPELDMFNLSNLEMHDFLHIVYIFFPQTGLLVGFYLRKKVTGHAGGRAGPGWARIWLCWARWAVLGHGIWPCWGAGLGWAWDLALVGALGWVGQGCCEWILI